MLCTHCGQEIIEKKRTISQNNALHLWCQLIADEARNKGLTMDALFRNPTELPINERIVKDFVREVGNMMFGKNSTASLSRKELNEVIKVCERAFAERLDCVIPFPSLQNNYLDE